MPQINLLSPNIGKKLKQKKQKSKTVSSATKKNLPLIYTMCGILIAALAASWIGLGFISSKREAEFSKLKQQESNLSVNPQYVIRTKKKRDNLKKRVEFLEGLSAKKFLWSEKLDRVADLIPYGVYLTRISLDNRMVASIDSSGQEAKVQKSVIALQGAAVAFKIKGAVELVEEFYKNLKNDKSFEKDFSDISTEKISKSVIHGRDIMKFEIHSQVK